MIVYIKLTNDCQLACRHCYNSICNNKDYMSEDTLRTIFHRLENLLNIGNNVTISLHGGEPMLYPNLSLVKDLVVDLYNKFPGQVDVSATTNLVYNLDVSKLLLIESFTNNLVMTSWDYEIRFTEHQQHLWENNVRMLTGRGTTVRPIVTITQPLIRAVTPYAMLSYFDSLGLKTCNFERLTHTGRAAENRWLAPSNKDVDKWLAELYTANKKYSFDMEIPIHTSIENALKGQLEGCRARRCAQDVITFNPDGTIATCPNLGDKIVGEVAEVSVEKREAYSAVKRNIISCEMCRSEMCYTCHYYSVCNGDCFQLEWDNTGCPGLKKTIDTIKKANK